MKKTMMFLGVLSLGLAHAQQEFEGKVGINTETPSATLNVKSKTGTTDTTKNFELQNANGTKMVTVLDNGNVGINTDKPRQKFQVFGLANFSDSEIFTGSGYGLTVRNSTGKMAEFYYSDYTTKTYPRLQIKGEANKINIVTTYSTGGASLGIGTVTSPDLLFLREREHSENIVPLNYVGIGTTAPTHKLHIKPDENKDPLKLEGLQETTDANAKNLVVVDGVVKVGSANDSGTNSIKKGGAPTCSGEGDAGKINFGEITLNGKKTEAFGFCMKNGSTGNYGWYYIHGAASTTTGSAGAFGEGLQ